MIRPLLIVLSIASVAVVGSWAQAQQLHRRFEYKHSFRAPNLAQRDGTIPFWTVTGDAIASGEQLRLAPSMRSRKGIAWNKRAMTESQFWEVEFAVKVTGQGRIGADGLGFWYTANQGTLGPVFGSNDYWTGLGLMFDSFDNDGQRNNPYVALMINDGTRAYDHMTDGSQQMLSGCQKDFRNKPFPVRVKLQYINNVLTVLIHDGMTQQVRYEMCLRAENVNLPLNGYFGLSAATGGLADDHDVIEFSVYSMSSEQPKAQETLPQDEQKKYDEEFEKRMGEYEKERQKYREEHPDKVKEDYEDEFAKYFEDATARELRQIYDMQNSIHKVMAQMDEKLQGIQNQQQQHSQMLQRVGSGGAAVQPAAAAGGQQQQLPPIGGFQQDEKAEVIQKVRDIVAQLRDMRNYVNEIYAKTHNLEQKFVGGAPPQQPGQGQASVQAVGGGDMTQLRQYLDSIQTDVRNIRANQNNQQGQGYAQPLGGSSCPTCLSSTFFLAVIAAQSVVLVLLLVFRRGNEKAKFY